MRWGFFWLYIIAVLCSFLGACFFPLLCTFQVIVLASFEYNYLYLSKKNNNNNHILGLLFPVEISAQECYFYFLFF